VTSVSPGGVAATCLADPVEKMVYRSVFVSRRVFTGSHRRSARLIRFLQKYSKVDL
jgi:hypothetical protein